MRRLSEYNRSLIGGEFRPGSLDKMTLAEHCMNDVVESVRDMLHAQIVAIRDPREAYDMMLHVEGMDAGEDPPACSWPVTGG
jgi:hypothetical protein